MNQQPPIEQPVYILPPIKKRVIVPQIISLVILGTIFYLGILLNIALLQLTAKEEIIIKIGSLIILVLVVVLGIILGIRRSSLKYRFYREKIVFNKQEINYIDIINTNPKQDFIDKIFNTYSIILGNQFVIRNISKDVQIDNYLKQMINYAKNQQRF